MIWEISLNFGSMVVKTWKRKKEKLGLDMEKLSKMSESLLSFEESINAQMEKVC